jgi:hypothetical protein
MKRAFPSAKFDRKAFDRKYAETLKEKMGIRRPLIRANKVLALWELKEQIEYANRISNAESRYRDEKAWKKFAGPATTIRRIEKETKELEESNRREESRQELDRARGYCSIRSNGKQVQVIDLRGMKPKR